MHAHQLSWTEASGWRGGNGGADNADLVLFFGARQALACGSRYREMRSMFPRAHILGCSTGGQIVNDDITDEEIAVAALQFDATRLRLACEPAPAPDCSRACGEAIGRALAADDLAGIFVLSDVLYQIPLIRTGEPIRAIRWT
jgi:FIST N domain